jgi:hypothetical protein
MLIVAIRTYGTGALGARPPALRVWRYAPGTAKAIRLFPSAVDPR